jgi:hypothetical protein
MNIDLPSEFIAYIEQGGLTEGFIDGDEMPGCFVLWPRGEIKALDDGYQVGEYAPGLALSTCVARPRSRDLNRPGEGSWIKTTSRQGLCSGQSTSNRARRFCDAELQASQRRASTDRSPA